MARPQRSAKEIEAVKDDMLNQALDLLSQGGYESFSLHKLSNRLGVATKTIYNYYQNQDELYLCILTRGFEKLHAFFDAARQRGQTPRRRLDGAIRAYMEFGIAEPHIYDLMFTLRVPKYNDYVGTPIEPAAQVELAAAMKCIDIFVELMAACLADAKGVPRETLHRQMILTWAQMHGYVAGINNNLLDYMHPDPGSLKEAVCGDVSQNLHRRLAALDGQTI